MLKPAAEAVSTLPIPHGVDEPLTATALQALEAFWIIATRVKLDSYLLQTINDQITEIIFMSITVVL